MADESYDNHSDQESAVSRKRHYENENEHENNDKESRSRDPKRAYGKEPLLKLLVPNDAAGAIIGKGGANLGDLKSRYGASIRLSHNREFYPGTNERILILTGEVSQIIDLNNYIIDKVHQNVAEGRGNRSRDDRRGQQIKIIVPNSTAGIIIGRSGATIKELQEETKAKIMIVGRDESKVRGERLLTITGNTEQRIEAARQVISKIAADKDNMANTTLKYSYGSQDNRDNYGPMERNQPNGSGGNMYNQNNDPSMSAMSNNPLAALGLGGGGVGGANKLDNLAEVAQHLVGLSQLGTSIEKNIKTTVQIQMEIPEVLVNPIMGPQGNNLREFMQFSGANIRFSSSNEFISGSSVRILTIHGDLNQTQIGYHLVNQKITQVRNELAVGGFQRR